jgi:hypothetical protein
MTITIESLRRMRHSEKRRYFRNLGDDKLWAEAFQQFSADPTEFLEEACLAQRLLPPIWGRRGSMRRDDPPQIAEFLLTALASSSHAEAAIGDLNERFTSECQQLGERRAARLYWARTLRSLWPLLVRVCGKALKWGAVIATVRRLF